MNVDWGVREPLVCGATAGLTFAASFVFGGAITTALGPGTSGIVTIVITTIVVVFGAKLVDEIGALTLIVTLYSIFAIPTNMFGPPGPAKIIVGILVGISYEITVFGFKRLGREDLGYISAGAVGAIFAIFLIWGVLILVDPQGATASRLGDVILWIWIPYGILGVIGGWVGIRVYNQLEDVGPFPDLQSQNSQ